MGRGGATEHTAGAELREPGNRVIGEARSDRIIDGRRVELVVISWNDTTKVSVDVSVEEPAGSGTMVLLTGDESLDEMPTDSDLREIVSDYLSDRYAPRYTDYN